MPGRNIDYNTLTPRERDTYQRVARGITEARWSGRSPDDALREMGTTLETALRYAPEAFERASDGHWRVRGSDSLVRHLHWPTARGVETLVTQDSRVASEIARYDNAVNAFLEGNPGPLRAFRRRRLVTHDGRRLEFLTDEDELMRQARRGELSFESIYATTRLGGRALASIPCCSAKYASPLDGSDWDRTQDASVERRRPPALERGRRSVVCYRCLTGRADGGGPPFGQASDITQTTDANDHRLLSDLDFGRDIRLQGFLADDERELRRRLRGR